MKAISTGGVVRLRPTLSMIGTWTIARFIYGSGYAADTIDHHPVAMSLGNEFWLILSRDRVLWWYCRPTVTSPRTAFHDNPFEFGPHLNPIASSDGEKPTVSKLPGSNCISREYYKLAFESKCKHKLI